MEWQPLLDQLSRHLLGNLNEEDLQDLKEYENIDGYLGYPPATTELIELAENKLGFELPNSLRSFYLFSDGWHAADQFPIGIANVLPVSEIFLLSTCRMRCPEIYSDFVEQNYSDVIFPCSPEARLENCVVIIDLDGNELGFAIRTESSNDWPVVTYNPDGGDWETYTGFFELMSDGLKD